MDETLVRYKGGWQLHTFNKDTFLNFLAFSKVDQSLDGGQNLDSPSSQRFKALLDRALYYE